MFFDPGSQIPVARSLCNLIKEHQSRDISAVFEHCQAMGHNINQHNVKVHDKQQVNNTIKRRVWEAIAIKQRKPSLNRNEDLNLPPIYNLLLGIRKFFATQLFTS